MLTIYTRTAGIEDVHVYDNVKAKIRCYSHSMYRMHNYGESIVSILGNRMVFNRMCIYFSVKPEWHYRV